MIQSLYLVTKGNFIKSDGFQKTWHLFLDLGFNCLFKYLNHHVIDIGPKLTQHLKDLLKTKTVQKQKSVEDNTETTIRFAGCEIKNYSETLNILMTLGW